MRQQKGLGLNTAKTTGIIIRFADVFGGVCCLYTKYEIKIGQKAIFVVYNARKIAVSVKTEFGGNNNSNLEKTTKTRRTKITYSMTNPQKHWKKIDIEEWIRPQ